MNSTALFTRCKCGAVSYLDISATAPYASRCSVELRVAKMVPRFIRTFLRRSAVWALSESQGSNVAAIRRDALALTATSTTLPPSSFGYLDRIQAVSE